MSMQDHPYAEILTRVQKPGRYVGGEQQQVVKADDALRCRFVLAFPDVYEVGMSHLGTRILYDLINREPDLVCERSFSPWPDCEAQLRENDLPLISLETYTPLREFDVVGVSLQYELSYSNVLLNLDLGGVPLLTAERGDADPIVIAGGPTATHPEPLAAFVDALLVGEAEEVLPELLRFIGDARRAGKSRAEIHAGLARMPGVYVPSLYRVEIDERTGLQVVVGRTEAGIAAGAPERIERAWVRDLDKFDFPDRFPVPYAEAIFDRASVEITRGCTEGCRFCQAGIIYRPVRERSPEKIIGSVLRGVDNAGYTETSLTALSTADVSCIAPLLKRLVPELAKRKTKLGVASLRAYGLDDDLLGEIKRVGITGLTFAPEAGTQRMRDVINKNVSDEDIDASARRIFSRGYDRMKMYFIMGLPTETDEDVIGIVDTGRRVREIAKSLDLRRMPQVTVSVSQHVPKPHTPFQWAAMETLPELSRKVQLLRDLSRKARVGIKTHDARESWLECLFARGDRRLGHALLLAYRNGARFDGWREGFDWQRWLDALEEAGIEPQRYTQTLPVGARLPWDHIEIGLEPGFLASEYRKSLKGRASPPCGKPFGDKVHHRDLDVAHDDGRRLVCYDCGVACDMSKMRSDRIDALRSLQDMTTEPAVQRESIVPLQRLVGRLGRSNQADDSAFKASAEAPYSRLRLVFAKHDALRFLGHRDLLRILPRVFRRAGIDLAFSRGYNPIPRFAFGPALPLGASADAEVVDVDVLIDGSDRDLAGLLSPPEREALAASLLARVRAATVPGLIFHTARLVAPDEVGLGKLVAAADYVVDLAPADAERLRALLPERLALDRLPVTRPLHKKRRRGRKSQAAEKEIDVQHHLMSASVEADRLVFRVRLSPEGSARPREVVQALLGTQVSDHRVRRTRLLAQRGDDLVGFTELGPVPRR